MLILDSITTLLESFLYAYTASYFCDNKKINKKKVFLCFILIAILDSYLVMGIFDVIWIRQVISMIFIFVIIGIVYRKKFKAVMVPTGVISFIIACIATIIQNNFSNIFVQIYVSENTYFYTFFILCFVRCVSAILQLSFKFFTNDRLMVYRTKHK